ncbi:MAG: hypothetical protein IPM34_14730 [Saprospiraceae bacterium]|nr:hypothetical protein [Saprospiraceae bacterium]
MLRSKRVYQFFKQLNENPNKKMHNHSKQQIPLINLPDLILNLNSHNLVANHYLFEIHIYGMKQAIKNRLIVRLGSLVCLISGALWIIGWTLDIHRDSLIGAELVLTGYVLSVFAFTAIAAVHYQKLSMLGLLGYSLIIMAAVLFVPWAFLDIARLSGVAPAIDWYFVERNGPTGAIAIFGGAGFVFGYLLFGIDLLRTKVLNRWPAILMLLAAIQPLIFLLSKLVNCYQGLQGFHLSFFAYHLWKYSQSNKDV